MKILNVSKNRLFTAVTILSVVLMVSISCNKSTAYNTPTTGTTGSTGSTGGPGPNEVFIQGMAFNPSSISVTAGTTIKWTNKDGVAHTVTSNTNLFNSGSIATGGTFTFTFSTAGTYSYFCSIHPSMVASVTVN
jgi:plastocyanin